MEYEEKKLYEELEENGEVLAWWHAGFLPSGRKKLVKMGGKFYLMGHDGTGNYYFFAPFAREISKERAKDILADKSELSTKEIDKIVQVQ